jgi:hypothetical protein
MKLFKYMLLGIILVFGSFLSTASLAADWIKPGEERFKFGGGVFFANFDTKLRFDDKTTGTGTGTEVDLEDDLGFSSNETTFWLGGYWRFAAKHRFAAAYFQFDRDASVIANTDITIGDEIYPAGARLDSKFKFQVLPISYAYSFLKREKFELAGTIGLNWNKVDFDVSGSASLGDKDGDANVSADANVPLPLIGLLFDYHFTPKWSAGLHGEVFWLNIDADTFGFSGTFINLRASTEYWFFNNVGLGAAINWFSLDVDVDDGDWRGILDYQYWGPQVYAALRF